VRRKTTGPVVLAREAQGFVGFHAGSAGIAQAALVGARLILVGDALVVRGIGFVLVRRGLILIRSSLVFVRRGLIRRRVESLLIDPATGERPAPSIKIRLAYAHLNNPDATAMPPRAQGGRTNARPLGASRV
jgi:hypothetical protein